MGGISPFHWLLIAAVLLLLFGNRLPSVMRSLGQGVVEFKKGLQGVDDEVKNSGNKKIEDQPTKSPEAGEAKAAEVESAKR